METVSAAVRENEQKHFLVIELGDGEVRIPLSEDRPAQVKKAFNQLITRIKKGPFAVRLIGGGDDLFSQVAEEYLKQLNREIKEIYAEMVQHGLVQE